MRTKARLSTGFCADCSAAIWLGSTWCRKCAARHRPARGSISIPTCHDCGGRVAHPNSYRCWSCFNSWRRRTNVCQDCAGPVSGPDTERCQRCVNVRRREGSPSTVCPECGGQKGHSSARCQGCDNLRRVSGHLDWHQIVMAFVPAAFQAELNRADLEWSADRLSAASGVSVSAIRLWLSGANKPSRTELEAVAAVLAFERCSACTGLGYVDPGAPGKQALLDRVTKQRPTPQPLQPTYEPRRSGDGWTFNRNTLWLDVVDSRVRLTRKEAQVIGVLADANGHFVTAAQIGVATGISDDAVRTNLTRVRDKFRAASADFGAVVEHSLGAGYRVRMADRIEEAS